jgi:hypothetical protein
VASASDTDPAHPVSARARGPRPLPGLDADHLPGDCRTGSPVHAALARRRHQARGRPAVPVLYAGRPAPWSASATPANASASSSRWYPSNTPSDSRAVSAPPRVSCAARSRTPRRPARAPRVAGRCDGASRGPHVPWRGDVVVLANHNGCLRRAVRDPSAAIRGPFRAVSIAHERARPQDLDGCRIPRYVREHQARAFAAPQGRRFRRGV